MTKKIIDITEFEKLFKENYSKLCYTAYKITKNTSLAEDIVQDVFIKIWENKEHIEIKINAFLYLNRAVINACYNESSRKKVININPISETEMEKISFSEDLETRLDSNQLQNQIEKSLNKLPTKCRTIFILSRFENYKYREIAETLNISIKTVESQMGIAINKINTDLKPILAKHFPDLLIIALILSVILNLFKG